MKMVKEREILEKIRGEISTFKPKRLVIDSLNTLSDFTASTEYVKQLYLQRGLKNSEENLLPENITENLMKRRIMLAFMSELRNYSTTALLTSELPEKGEYLSADGISEFIADGVILLYYWEIGDVEEHALKIRKMRYSKHSKAPIQYQIEKAGIEIKEEM